MEHGGRLSKRQEEVMAVMNATSEERRNSSLLFVDNTTIVGKGSGPLEARRCAQELFSKAKEWFAANKLKLNEDKTQKMLCTLSTHTPGDEAVNLLGFGIDAKLSWEPHIDQHAQIIGKADEERLLKDRKLVLLVDLDQTLIHTTNDNIPNNLKDVFHFQLYGPKSPWYHTRFRPRTNQFLMAMSEYYELHICTFGARNYAHMIARFLDPDGKFFSHRILSRDECFNPNSKMANLKALFPCGDNMVCIIDDREDVWNFAPNLIHVKPYHFFSHTGDIHAPPGLSKCENDEKEGIDFSQFAEGTKVKSKAGKFKSKNGLKEKKKKEVNDSELEEGELKSADNSISESELENIEKCSISTNSITAPPAKPVSDSESTTDNSTAIPNSDVNDKEKSSEEQLKCDEAVKSSDRSADSKAEDSNVDSESTTTIGKKKVDSTEGKEEKSDEEERGPVVDANSKTDDETGSIEDIKKVEPIDSTESGEPNEKLEESKECKELDSCNKEDKTDSRIDSSIKEDKTDSTLDNSNKEGEKDSEVQNGPDVTCSDERLKKSEEDNLLEVEESDDYLLYLEDILKKIHAEFYHSYDSKQDADLKQIVPTLKEKVLAGTKLVFSGLVPTHAALEQSKAYYIARSLGAEVTKELDKETTHLIAVRSGTAKMNAAKKMKHVRVVTPDWLWSCAERWERVEELLFPVTCEKTSSRHPPPHCVSPTHGMPAQRQRTPSGRFMDTINPLMSFSSEDIADMDAEVEDICNESESDGEGDAQERPAKRKKFESTFENDESSSSSADSLSGENIRGWSKKRLKPEEPDMEEEESLNTRFRRGEELPSDVDLGEDSGASVGSEEPMDDISDGDWNMMGAALEREFLEGD
ncbi:LOW QUALITY PROTEIN: RNA polymerase II subunit A C-terminal domain phosphatase-like [Nilaparvata lugens]|uniref:LOW QUALITY PROTEIN: RNA polymerase II subunit A C-terminal domain phosphatase-like n=1 Tax=Nilaparvata lugens TaxID=108931 RepID=UPI00193D4942|nr:LOW QUALITY PROTEIN: RNA polymerase II subunit A C-terminal domain phosphatase-like [Nilaparvata lugens]